MDTLTREEMLRKTKMEQSHDYFKQTKIQSCSKVVVEKGKPVAMCYPQKKTGYKAPNSYVNKTKSSETSSKAHDDFKMRSGEFVGMNKKPLYKYHPDAPRSRLAQPTVVMHHKNFSTVVIGDQSNANKKQYVTTNSNVYKAINHSDVTSHPGILASKTQAIHKEQLQ